MCENEHCKAENCTCDPCDCTEEECCDCDQSVMLWEITGQSKVLPCNPIVLQESGEVSAENTKYAEHYISYGYSFHIYGNFAEIL